MFFPESDIYSAANKKYMDAFGDSLPAYQIPASETDQSISDKVDICVHNKKDNFLALCGVSQSKERIY